MKAEVFVHTVVPKSVRSMHCLLVKMGCEKLVSNLKENAIWYHTEFLFPFIFNSHRELVLLTEVAQVDLHSSENSEEAWVALAMHPHRIFMSDDPTMALPTLTPRAVCDKVRLLLQ